MTELESVERDIALLRARVRYSRLAIADPNITPEAIDREHAGSIYSAGASARF